LACFINANFISLFLEMLSIIMIFSAYSVGTSRNMDKLVPEPIEMHVNAMSVAISDIVYGLDKGYVRYSAVKNSIQNAGVTKRPDVIKRLSLDFSNNLRDPERVKNALTRVQNTAVPVAPSFRDRSMFTMVYAGLGLVDYYKASYLVLALHQRHLTYYIPFFSLLVF